SNHPRGRDHRADHLEHLGVEQGGSRFLADEANPRPAWFDPELKHVIHAADLRPCGALHGAATGIEQFDATNLHGAVPLYGWKYVGPLFPLNIALKSRP